MHAERKPVAQRAHALGIGTPPHQNSRHVTKPYLALNVEFRKPVVIDPEGEVLLARARQRDGGLLRRERGDPDKRQPKGKQGRAAQSAADLKRVVESH